MHLFQSLAVPLITIVIFCDPLIVSLFVSVFAGWRI